MLSVEISKKLPNDDLNLTFHLNNEITVLIGKSGAGKTTVLDCIAGIKTPNTGAIQSNDDIWFQAGKVNLPPQKRRVGYVFQQYALFPHMNVEKNIYYGVPRNERTYVQDHVEYLMNSFEMNHLIHKHPSQLSGGEQQRVAVIRALATKPEVLLMDEPFSALDEETKQTAYQQLLRLKEDWEIPILLVTHNRQEANKVADKILQLKEGILVEHVE